MKVSFEYHSPSFALGAIVALWWAEIVSPWWLLLIPFLLIRIGKYIHPKNGMNK